MFDWEEGPNLALARTLIMCGTMRKDGKYFILAVGGQNGTAITSQDCEYMELPTIKWEKCTNLPIGLCGGQLIEDPETGDALLLGGFNNGTGSKRTIYRLSHVNGQWILQNQTLKAGRSSFAAMVVPPGILNCDKSEGFATLSIL